MISTQLSGDILKPQFMEQLNYLRERSKCHEEKDRCDHLAACLLLSSKHIHNKLSQPEDKPQGRPKTAMAALGGSTWNPYETTMNREFTHKISSTQALRPQTSKGYRNPYCLSDPVGMSMYSDEFGWKPYSKPEPIRAATSSGTRSNNPQANKAFTVWKLSREEQKAAFDTCTPLKRTPTAEDFQRAMKAQFSSTYRGDFLGIPQGFQVKYALTPTLNWKKQIPRPLETESRFHYQIQPHAPELQNFTYKYGCYANRHLPAKGVVPTVLKSHIQNQEHRKQLTTYQRHFGKEYIDLPSLVRSMNPEELNTYLDSVPPEDKAAVEQILISVTGRGYQNLKQKSSQMKVHGHQPKPKK